MVEVEIKPIGLLAEFSEQDLNAMAQCAHPLHFRKDQEILKEGETNASLYMVQSGLLHARRQVERSHTLLGRLEAGGFFGEVSVFNPGPTTATIHAVTDGDLWRLGRDSMLQFIDSRPAAGAKMLRRIMEEMAVRLRNADDRMTEAIIWGGLLRS
jgi:CRP-like cAMP-binding protein